ncbi:hypothetical protein YC2023_040345 [Brassica napus]
MSFSLIRLSFTRLGELIAIKHDNVASIKLESESLLIDFISSTTKPSLSAIDTFDSESTAMNSSKPAQSIFNSTFPVL